MLLTFSRSRGYFDQSWFNDRKGIMTENTVNDLHVNITGQSHQRTIVEYVPMFYFNNAFTHEAWVGYLKMFLQELKWISDFKNYIEAILFTYEAIIYWAHE